MTNADRADAALTSGRRQCPVPEGGKPVSRECDRMSLQSWRKASSPLRQSLAVLIRVSRPSLSSMQFSASYLSFALREMSCPQKSRAVCSMRAHIFRRLSLSSSGIPAAGLSMLP